MNTAAAAAAHNAASLQLFGSSYLRNATEFMAAANKTTTTTHQNHLIATANGAATAAIAPTTTTLTLPATTPLNAAALSFETTRDKTTMTTTTTTNLLELQSNAAAAAQALNLIRLPTPPTSATICGGGVGGGGAGGHGENSTTNSTHHMTPTQILFQTAAAATNSPTPTLLNLSATGPNSAAATSAAILPRAHSFGASLTQNVGPPTPAGDEPASTTTTPLPLNFKTTMPTGVASDSCVENASNAAATCITTQQPQMQDVNIQTETPVCSEDENSTCLLAQQTTLSHHAADGCLTPPTYHSHSESSEEAVEPLELTKNRHGEAGETNLHEQTSQAIKSNTCHNAAAATANEATSLTEPPTSQADENEQPLAESDAITTNNENVYAAAAATTTNDFAGLELLSNISTSTLATKPTTAAAILRVKQEPPDSMEEMQQQLQQHHYQQQQQQTIFMPTIAAKLEHPTTTTTTCNNGAYQAAMQHEEALNQNHVQSNSNENVASNSIMPTLVEAEPMPSGLNLLCAVLDREEEGVEGSSLFAATANPSSQRATPTALSNYSNFYQQSQLKTPPPPPQPQQSYTTHFPTVSGGGNDLSATSVGGLEPPAIAASPHLAMHIKRKKRKHSKSSKSSTPTMSTSSPCSVLLSNASGQQSPPLPSSIQCNSSGKSSKRSSKKSKKKYSKEKRRQQRAAAAAAAAAELDFTDEQLKLELQKAFINGGGSAGVISNAASKWPSAHEIFNIMETSMRQKLAKITRQYRKKKRKLEEISKTQREKKKSTKLLTQQLQQQMQLQQQALQPPPTAATLATTSALVGNPLAAATNSSPLVDYKFNTKFSTNAAAATGPQISTATTYLQPSSFPLRFPPQATSTADEDSDRNSQQQQQQQQQQHKHRTHNKQRHQQNIFKPVRLEPSALSAAVVANGNNNNNNNIGNNTNNSSCCIISNNSNSNNAANKDNFSSINAALRLAQQQQHQQQQQNLASSTNVKERKLSGGKLKTKRRTSESNTKPTPNIESNGIADAATAGVSPPKRLRNQFDLQLTLTNEHLYRKETRVLTDMGGLFYAGIMKPLQPPDIYAITLDGERGNKPHIMSREEIFKDTILEVAPKSIDCVPVGTRLCAYWSQQYRCLYPGRAIESESSEGDEEETAKKDFVSVEFDDGDSGRIRLQNIRLLMSDYPIVEYNDNPLYSLGKQKKTTIKSGSGGASGIIGGVPDTSAALHDTSLGLSALMLGGEDGDEMYARRTEKKRLKKNPKKKSQPSLMKKAAAILSSNINSNANNDAVTAADGNDHGRKHHKHKKHKKHKKHHRKTSNLQTIEYSTSATTNGFKMTANNCSNVGYKSTLNLNNNGFGVSDDFDDGGVDNESSRENAQFSAVAHKPIKIEEASAAAAAVGVKVKTERIEDVVEEESASNMMSENSDEAKGDDDDDEVEHNNSKGSKIAAFLPERQLWGWQGMAYRRAGVKGRARKQFYKTIKRGKELITVGDCAVFLSTGRPDRPYIGRIESMWETASSNKVVRVRWFYHPEETTGCPTLKYPGGLFESPHEDENDVQTISHRCEVLPFERYHEKFGDDAKKYQSIYDNNDTYYLAGYYNPRALVLNLQDDIPTAANTTMPMTAATVATASATNSNGSLIITKNKSLKPAIVGNGPEQNTSTGTSIP